MNKDSKIKNMVRINDSKFLSLLFVMIILSCFSTVFGQNQNLEVKRILVAYDEMNTDNKQLIEVILRNRSDRQVQLIGRLNILLPNYSRIFYGNKLITAPASSDTRVLFSYFVKKFNGGDYQITALFYDKEKENLLVKGETTALFKANGPKMPSRERYVRGKDGYLIINKKDNKSFKRNTTFDPPDLVWKLNQVLESSILRGESTAVRLALANDGGDVAKDVDYAVYWYFTKQAESSRRKTRIFKGTVEFMAPGEKKIFEIPVSLPPKSLKGKYKIEAVVDVLNKIKEISEDNNVIASSNTISFQDIALEIPTDQYSFAESGLFLYKWRSTVYSKFKVQFSADPEFSKFEELPKDTMTQRYEVMGHSSEVPSLGFSLMSEINSDRLYWRVLASNVTGESDHSEVRTFFINKKSE